MSKTSRCCTLVLAAALLAFAAPSAFAAPTPSFTFAPASPQSGTAVTFTSTSTAPTLFAITNIEWDFDGNGAFEVSGLAPVQHTFPAAGSYTVNMRATSNELLDNQATATATVVVTTRPPTADFSFAPTSPSVNDAVLFASNSTDPDGETLGHVWNFGDGTAQSTQRNPTHAYATPGQKTVRLTVNDGHGGVDDLTKTITVKDPSAANASFTFTPQSPVADQAVTFTSTATPSAGQTISSQNWDLDSDGQYDDGSGKTVTRRFDSPGVYRVALRVVQANGNPAVAEGTVRVGAIVESPPTTSPTQPTTPTTPGKPPKGRPSLLTPFPVVRLVGAAYQTRTIVSVLSVQSPRGALVRARCKGTGCPKVVRRKRSKGKAIRFKTFERGIRAGAKLEVFVLANKRIGKYTSFKMQRGKPPRRTDRCLVPGKRKPVSCPK